MIVDIEFLVC